MPGRTELRTATRNVPSYWIKFAGLVLVATICLAGGLDSLIQHFRAIEPRPYRAASGLLLVLCGLAQIRLLIHEPSRSRLQGLFSSQEQWWLLRFSLIVASAGYALALLIGPDTNLRYAFRAWAAIGYTGCLWYLLARKTSASSSSWRHRWQFPRCESAATCIVVLLLTVEIAMRLQAAVTNDAIGGIAIARRQAFDPGSLHRGRRVNQLGYWDDEFDARVHPERFRIAALGDSVVLGGDRETNCLEQMEAILPDTDVYNFTLPGLGPREFAAQLKCDVLTYHPDLVLLFVSIHDDVTYQMPLPDVFDWRGLRICQWGLQTIAAPASMWHSPGSGTSIDGFPRTEYDQIARFAVCRTPIEDHVEQRWQRTLSHLSTMVELCLEHDIPLALVFVPAAFQVDANLRRRICLRGGYEESHVDLRLPQRRLISFASQNEIPALDLLPEISEAADYMYEADRPEEFNATAQNLVATVVADWVARSFELEISERRESLLAADEMAPPSRSASVPRRGSRRDPEPSTVK